MNLTNIELSYKAKKTRSGAYHCAIGESALLTGFFSFYPCFFFFLYITAPKAAIPATNKAAAYGI